MYGFVVILKCLQAPEELKFWLDGRKLVQNNIFCYAESYPIHHRARALTVHCVYADLQRPRVGWLTSTLGTPKRLFPVMPCLRFHEEASADYGNEGGFMDTMIHSGVDQLLPACFVGKFEEFLEIQG
jgi:hypothetical protein